MRLIRVFPTQTKASPDDGLAFFGDAPLPGLVEADAVHISCLFTWDLPRAEYLAESWGRIAPTSIGGPATGERSEEFVPGLYVKQGYTITSRGCPNRCWFCSVWRREGSQVRELPIADGWNLLDDNILACSEAHIRAVFAMLKRQKRKAEFTGGLEAARLKPWHVDLLSDLKPQQMFFAYDTPNDYEPLVEAGNLMGAAGFTLQSRKARCYVLIGQPKDTFEAAEARLMQTLAAGFLPMAMLYRDEAGKVSKEWRRFQRIWARPATIAGRGLIPKAEAQL